jgi:hypothetical protein
MNKIRELWSKIGSFFRKQETIHPALGRINIYYLYSIDEFGNTKFCGRFASRHRLLAAVNGLGLEKWFYEKESKRDEYL